jgi:CO/xanthine dehydrogenase Mo-binding subunit
MLWGKILRSQFAHARILKVDTSRANAMPGVECVLTGYEMLEKEVTKSGNSGRVYVPIDWIGKTVKIILIER